MRSHHKVFTLICFLFQLCIPVLSYGLSPEITRGVIFLVNTQSTDGSWGNVSTATVNVFYSTYEASQSLYTIDPSLGNPINGVVYLLSDPVENTIYLTKKILASKTIGKDYSTFLTNLVLNQKEGGGFSGIPDISPDILNTAQALQALNAVNYLDQAVLNASLGYLTSTQNADGGWGFYQGDGSNVYMTAVVSMTLQQFPTTPTLATALSKATAYLKAHQNTDGGFGSSPSTVYETALAYLALVGLTTDTAVLGGAGNFLLTTQFADGSWEQDPYSTARALHPRRGAGGGSAGGMALKRDPARPLTFSLTRLKKA